MAEHAKKRILVVDDDAEIRAIIKKMLERGGYEVLLAGDAVKAGEILDSQPPVHLIVLDIMLPQKDGYTFCEELKEAPRF